MIKTKLCELLNIEYPIIQGGMAWVATAELAAAVSNAGDLGVIGTGHMPPDVLRLEIKKVKNLTKKSYGVNMMLMSPYIKELIKVIDDEKVPIITTGAGNPGEYISILKKIGCKVIPVVASVALAKRLVRYDITAIIAEGMESGGHIGEVTTMALIPQIVDVVSIPVIAAGGIADARGLIAALALGAQGVQLGSRFVAATECTAHSNYKKAVLNAKERSTIISGRSTGHPVRVIINKLTKEIDKMEKNNISANEIERYGEGKLRAAVQGGDIKFGSVMIGQIAGMINEIKPAAEIIKEIVEEIPIIINNINNLIIVKQEK